MTNVQAAGVQGRVAAGFEPVKELFEQQFAQGQHIGAGVAVYHRGRPVVDLWGGLADEESGRPWEEGTMAVSFSTTKGLTATCLHILAERGLLKYGDPVAKYWPEFAVNGKEAVTIYQLLTHQAGIPQLPDGVRAETLLDWNTMVSEIAKLAPVWEPGTNTGYHAITFGYLVGESCAASMGAASARSSATRSRSRSASASCTSARRRAPSRSSRR